MNYFPAFLNLKGKPCLLVGGGSVASRKADMLLTAGARLTIVAPEICPKLTRQVVSGQIIHRVGSFKSSDVNDSAKASRSTRRFGCRMARSC